MVSNPGTGTARPAGLQTPQPPVLPLSPTHPGVVGPTGSPDMASPVQSRVGAGFPVALQRNSAICPGCTVSCGGWMETTGADGVPEADGGHGGMQSGWGVSPLLLLSLPLL